MDLKNGKTWISVILVVVMIYGAPGIVTARSPDFFISNLQGDRFNSEDYKGVIVISFFFIDCIPCRVELPQLNKLIKSHQKKKVRLLMIDPLPDDTFERLDEFADKLGLPLKNIYHDPLGMIAQKFNTESRFPTVIVLENGKEIFRFHELTDDKIGQLVKLVN